MIFSKKTKFHRPVCNDTSAGRLAAALLIALLWPAAVQAQDLQKKVADIYESTGASVLNITSKVMMPNVFNMKVPRKGTGSGFVYDEKGHVVTNYHVVKNATKIMVSLSEDEIQL